MEHCLKLHSYLQPLKTCTMGGGRGEQGIKEEITTNFRTRSPTSLLITTHFIDGEIETRKGNCPKIQDSKPDCPGRDHLLLYHSAPIEESTGF